MGGSNWSTKGIVGSMAALAQRSFYSQGNCTTSLARPYTKAAYPAKGCSKQKPGRHLAGWGIVAGFRSIGLCCVDPIAGEAREAAACDGLLAAMASEFVFALTVITSVAGGAGPGVGDGAWAFQTVSTPIRGGAELARWLGGASSP